MKKARRISILCLTLILMIIATALPASAKGINPQQLQSDLVTFPRTEVWVITHIKEDVEIVQGAMDGDYTALEKYLTDPKEQEIFLRSTNYSFTLADVIKTTFITINPQNTERGEKLAFQVKGQSFPVKTSGSTGLPLNFTFLSTGRNAEKEIDVYPFLAYRDRNGNLVVLSTLTNNMGKKITITGIPHIELNSQGKIIAEGDSQSFDKPITLATRINEVNTGVESGFPTKCFLKMTFEPGTYDPSIDISVLDNLSCAFALDYQVDQ